MSTLSTEQADEFLAAILKLKKEAEERLSKKDFLHLKQCVWLNHLLFFIGLGTAWILPNPLSILLMSTGLHGQWTIVAHHVLHGAYDNIPSIPLPYHSSYFARGWRRLVDWLDWMYPPAWIYEHNILHHFYTNEKLDPDRVLVHIKQRYRIYPLFIRVISVAIAMAFWKPYFMSKNTLKAHAEKKKYDAEKDYDDYSHQAYLYNYLPYISVHFIVLPLLFFPLGLKAVLFVFINRLGAEILTNLHSFCTIVSNHTGSDIMLRDEHFTTRAEFYLQQIETTCNYHTGKFWLDYLQGYLNYQIEHHLFPTLPPSQYVLLQPKIKALCEHYQITYRQESIIARFKKTLAILLLIDDMETMPLNKK